MMPSLHINPRYTAVTLAASADWSCHDQKRWLAWAVRQPDGSWQADPPCLAEQPGSLLSRLWEMTPQPGALLVGFDFPIGLPLGYARRAGVQNFLDWLPDLGTGLWARFFDPAGQPEEISLYRPFYPKTPGNSRRIHLTQALGLDWQALFRQCDLRSVSRPAASALFWTMGAKQVGKAALHGWRQVLQPALADENLHFAIWPFSGCLADLLQAGQIVCAEIYPAEYAVRLGIRNGKRSEDLRRQNALRLAGWAERHGLAFHPALAEQIHLGFPERQGGEDAFDAVIGLLGMLEALTQPPELIEPQETHLRTIEGWILGQKP